MPKHYKAVYAYVTIYAELIVAKPKRTVSV